MTWGAPASRSSSSPHSSQVPDWPSPVSSPEGAATRSFWTSTRSSPTSPRPRCHPVIEPTDDSPEPPATEAGPDAGLPPAPPRPTTRCRRSRNSSDPVTAPFPRSSLPDPGPSGSRCSRSTSPDSRSAGRTRTRRTDGDPRRDRDRLVPVRRHRRPARRHRARRPRVVEPHERTVRPPRQRRARRTDRGGARRRHRPPIRGHRAGRVRQVGAAPRSHLAQHRRRDAGVDHLRRRLQPRDPPLPREHRGVRRARRLNRTHR